jgi:hypothetical protein
MESMSLIVLWNKRIIPWNKDCLWRIEEISHRTDGTSAASSMHARDAAADFKRRGIKRDPSQFPILKDDKQ